MNHREQERTLQPINLQQCHLWERSNCYVQSGINLLADTALHSKRLAYICHLQVDTFETVKNNVFDMLGDLAQDFNNEQLDVLFSKFEDCNGRPIPDAMKIMDLMRRLAKSDTKVMFHEPHPESPVQYQ